MDAVLVRKTPVIRLKQERVILEEVELNLEKIQKLRKICKTFLNPTFIL